MDRLYLPGDAVECQQGMMSLPLMVVTGRVLAFRVSSVSLETEINSEWLTVVSFDGPYVANKIVFNRVFML